MDPDGEIIIASIHEFKDLCTIYQDHVAAIIPQAAIMEDPPDEPEAGAGDGAIPNQDPYRVPPLPSEMPSVRKEEEHTGPP